MEYNLDYEFRIILPKSCVFNRKNKRMPKKQPILAGYEKEMGEFLKSNGIRTRIRGKLSEGSTEILDVIRAGYASYVINTRAIMSGIHYEDGMAIRGCAAENNVTMFTSLDTVRVLLDVLEEITIGVSKINEE